MAYFEKKSTGWLARVSWYDDEHVRHYKKQQGFRTKALARIWANEKEHQLMKGITIDDDSIFVAYFDSWYATYKEPKLADITKARYHNVSKVLTTYFRNKPLKSITRKDYQQFINFFGANHAPQTVRKTNSIIRACVQSAILDGLIYRDFTQRITLTANVSREIHVEYLNLHEIRGLLNQAKNNLNPGYTSRYMIITAIYTGMRLSEIQALTWNDIEWKDQLISINKSWSERKRNFKQTKNKSSLRTIKVNKELLVVLRQLRKHTNSNMAFTTQFGTIPTSGAVNKTLRKLLDECGYHKKNFHFHGTVPCQVDTLNNKN